MNENEDYIIRKRKLRDEGLLEIPMMIDPDRYFIANIKVKDIAYTSPFIILTIIILTILYNTGNLNITTATFSFTPPILMLALFWIKHPDRKNISLIEVIFWKIKFKLTKKVFQFSKERKDKMEDDIRSKLGIFNIANDCLETLDNRLIKVIDVTSVNLTGMSFRNKDKTYSSYQSFLNSHPQEIFPIQTVLFSKPINLKNYISWVNEKTSNMDDYYKRMLAQSYIEKTNQIQKSKNMVSKSRYVIISEKIGSDKEKALQKLSENAERMVSGIGNMLGDRYKLEATILDNEKLFDYIYSCIDYENAQIFQSVDRKSNFNSYAYSYGSENLTDDDFYLEKT